MKKTKVLIVEDHIKIAEALSTMLSNEGYEIVAICPGEIGAFEKTKSLLPDVVLMDINLKEGDGLSCTKSIKTEIPETAVIALTMYNDQRHLNAMLDAGANGYVTKSSSKVEILKSIEFALAGKVYICEEMRKDEI